MIKTTAIILAAGKSKRAGRDKQFYKISNKFIIQHTFEKFKNIDEITEIILVLSKNNLNKYKSLFKDPKIKLTVGGDTRIQSLINGSQKISYIPDVVIVHDGARPFVSTNLIKQIIINSEKYGCTIPVIPIKDTIKEIDIKKFKVIKTPKRDILFAVQTPQGYRYDIFKKIISAANKYKNLTDDSQIAEKLKIHIKAIIGEETNIKITTPLDFKIAEVIYEETKKQNWNCSGIRFWCP